LNGTYQLLAYAHDINLQGRNINTENSNVEILLDTVKEDGLKENQVQYMKPLKMWQCSNIW